MYRKILHNLLSGSLVLAMLYFIFNLVMGIFSVSW